LTENKELLVQYLLGNLSEEAEERLEQEYFLDQEKWIALRAAEDDLVHNYAGGRLSDTQRRQMEASFLISPRVQARVELARLLLDLQECRQSGCRSHK